MRHVPVHSAARLAAAFLAAMVLASCAGAGPTTLPELTFAHLEPIRFDAATVRIVDSYRPPLAAPNVEHTFPLIPAEAARRWAARRITAAGASGSLVVTILDASVVAVELPVRAGIGGMFFDEQKVRYDAALEVTIEYEDGPPLIEQAARTRVTRSRTVPESISPNERGEVFYELVEGLVNDLDDQLVAAIRQYLASVVL